MPDHEPSWNTRASHRAALSCARFPDRDAAELERIAARVVIDLQDAPAGAGLDPHRHCAAGVEEVDRATDPPAVDLARERGERAHRIDGHLDCRRRRLAGHACSFSST
jgi:hypothetical protein